MDNGWSIQLDAQGPVGEEVSPAALEELVDVLIPYNSSVSGGGHRYSARFDVEIPIAVDAIREASDIFSVSAEKAGLPLWPVVSVVAQTFAEQERELDEPLLPDLVGVAEAAEILGVTRQRISQLVQASNPRFPQPLFELAATPVWTRSQIERFGQLWSRKPGRPAKFNSSNTAIEQTVQSERQKLDAIGRERAAGKRWPKG